MPRVIFQVGEEERRLYVKAAHRELVTLSEWLRRAAEVRLNGGLAAGDAVGDSGLGTDGSSLGGEPTTGADNVSDDRSPAANPAKKCSREARHHINHSGKPCPECGYPTA